MSEKNNKKVIMAKDTVIYMLAKSIEGLVGVLTISSLSYIYSPKDIGKYSTLNIAVTTISLVCIQWLVQSVLRYINKYKVENKLKDFFSTIFIAWLKVNLITGVIFSFGLFILTIFKNNYFFKFLESYPIPLLISVFIMFFSYNTSQLILALLAGVRKVKTNLTLSIINVFGKLILIISFNKIFTANILWIFISYSILDFVSVIIGVFSLKIYKNIEFKRNSKNILKELKVYGIPLMGNMIATSILNKSDIYIIKFFSGDFYAGIYQTNYSIIASAFTLLNAGAMRGSYPTILKTWSEGKKDMAKELIKSSVRIFLLISIPAVFGVFALSSFISGVLFEKSYYSGHSIMGFVALGMLFLGLTEYAIKPWELGSKTKSIFKRSTFCGVLNIFLNIALVPYFSFKICAINTFISFLIYFFLAKIGTKNYIKWEIKKIVYFRIILSSFLMYCLIIFLKTFINPSLINLIILVIVGIIFYFLSLYFTGEINAEVKNIFKKLKNK